MTLYEIRSEFAGILAKIDELDGELPPDLETQLDNVQMNFDAKVEATLRYRANRMAKAGAIQNEIARLKAMADLESRAADRLWDYVHSSMGMLGLKKAGGELFPVRVQKNSKPSFDLVDKGAPIPETYRRVKIEVALDRDKAYQDWKAGNVDILAQNGIAVNHGTHLRNA